MDRNKLLDTAVRTTTTDIERRTLAVLLEGNHGVSGFSGRSVDAIREKFRTLAADAAN